MATGERGGLNLLGTQCLFLESPYNYVTHLKEACPVPVI